MNDELKKRIIKKLKSKYDLQDEKEIDWAFWDDTLDVKNNLITLIETYKLKPKITNQDKQDLIVKAELDRQEYLKGLNEQMKEEEQKIIEQIKSEQPNLDKYYTKIKDYIDVLKKSNKIHGLVLYGCYALGKTRFVMKNVNDKYTFISGHITPLKLYSIICEYSDSLIIIDDPTDIFINKDSYSLLLQALQTETKRIVQWQSTTQEENGLPLKVEFKGKIIIVANRINEDSHDVLLSRCLVKEIKFSLYERQKILYEFCNENNIPNEIMDYVATISNNANSESINFRFILKAYEFYKEKKDWKEFVSNELELNEHIKLILDLENTVSPIKDKIKQFIEQTGMSRKTYYNYRNRINV